MNHQLRPVVTNDRDDLKKIGIPSRPEIQPRVVVLVVNAHYVLDHVFDVLIGHAMFPCRRMDLHRRIVIRNTYLVETAFSKWISYDHHMGTPLGFWSYVHKDNDAMHGAIGRLAEHVQEEYGVLTGGIELDLFLDSASLKWGNQWGTQLKGAIQGTTFFIPIITPRYFASEECRNELLGFAEQAGELGVEGLIMPLYLVDVPAIETGDLTDPAVRLVADSQMEDWRTLRFLDETTQPYRLAVNRLAKRLWEVSQQRGQKAVISESSVAPADGEKDEEPEPASLDDIKTMSELNGSGSVSAGEMGLLELLAEGEAAFPRITETLQAISAEIETVGTLTTEATDEIKQSDEQGKGFKGRLAVANRLATHLTEPADKLEQLASQYTADLVILDPAVTQLIGLVAEQAEESPTESEEFFSSVTGLVKSTRQAGEAVQGMITVFDDSASFSRELEIPIKQMRSSLQSLIDGQHVIETWEGMSRGQLKART